MHTERVDKLGGDGLIYLDKYIKLFHHTDRFRCRVGCGVVLFAGNDDCSS